MKEITAIAKFKEGTRIQGFFLCQEKHLRFTRSGDLYLDLVLRDRTGRIGAKVWDKVTEYNDKFAQGDPVAVSGEVETFNERLQLIVKKINRASLQHYGRYGYDPALIVPTAPQDPQEMWKRIVTLIRGIGNRHLQRLVSVLYRAYKEQLLILPASMTLHHSYRSGYLEHVLSMATLGGVLARHYALDEDLLMAGIFLHDIGKVRELTGDLETRYTDQGNFIGHIVIGRDLVRDAIRDLEDFPGELQLKLEHMLLAHQGTYEWQSPKKPVFREALVLHLLDNLDAKLNLMDKIIADDQGDGLWTDIRNYFRVPLYKGDDAASESG